MFPMNPGKILVVEDEEQVRTLIVRLLEKQGYSVSAGENGQAALAVAASNGQPSLLITDMIMPLMGGLALLQELRARWPDLPALCMTGYTREEIMDGDKLENVSFIEKPFAPAAFLEQVADLLRSSG
jgi:two-component system, cell cycle sensor histidine kinase and response regulator CckA